MRFGWATFSWRLLPICFNFTSISLLVRTNKNMISFHKHVHTLSSTHFKCSIFERKILSIFTNWMKMIHNLLANECNLCFGYTRALQFGSICKTIHLNKLQRAVNFLCLKPHFLTNYTVYTSYIMHRIHEVESWVSMIEQNASPRFFISGH